MTRNNCVLLLVAWALLGTASTMCTCMALCGGLYVCHGRCRVQAALEVTRDAVALAELLPKRWADFIRNG